MSGKIINTKVAPVMFEGVSEFLQVFLGLVNARTYCYYSVDVPVRICNLDRDLCRDISIPRFTIFKGYMLENKPSYIHETPHAINVFFNVVAMSAHDYYIPEPYKLFIRALLEVEPVKLTGYLKKLREVWSRVSIDEYEKYLEQYMPHILLIITTPHPEDVKIANLKEIAVPVYPIHVEVYDYTGGQEKKVMEKYYDSIGQPYGVMAEQVFEDFYEELRKGDYLFKKSFPELW